MKRRLFEDLVVSAAGGKRARAGLGWPVSLTLHAVGVAGLMALPALKTDALPDPPPRPISVPIVVLPAPVPHPPRPIESPRPSAGASRRSGPVVTTRRMVSMPTTVPDTPPQIGEEETLTIDDPHGDVGFCIGACQGRDSPADSVGGPPGGNGTGTGTGPVPIGGLIKPPTKIRDARPVFPTLAQQIRVQGPVVLECIISTDGHVEHVQIVSGHPLLQQPALDAVRQWRYTPTLLNGVPVSVIMTVTVNFILS